MPHHAGHECSPRSRALTAAERSWITRAGQCSDLIEEVAASIERRDYIDESDRAILRRLLDVALDLQATRPAACGD